MKMDAVIILGRTIVLHELAVHPHRPAEVAAEGTVKESKSENKKKAG